MAAVTPIPIEEQYTTQNGLLPILGLTPTKAYFAYAEPADGMAYIEVVVALVVVVVVVVVLQVGRCGDTKLVVGVVVGVVASSSSSRLEVVVVVVVILVRFPVDGYDNLIILFLPSSFPPSSPSSHYYPYYSLLQDKQTLYVALIVVCQLLILCIMNYLTYLPYAQLMNALQVRGFVKPGDKPTFGKVANSSSSSSS